MYSSFSTTFRFKQELPGLIPGERVSHMMSYLQIDVTGYSLALKQGDTWSIRVDEIGHDSERYVCTLFPNPKTKQYRPRKLGRSEFAFCDATWIAEATQWVSSNGYLCDYEDGHTMIVLRDSKGRTYIARRECFDKFFIEVTDDEKASTEDQVNSKECFTGSSNQVDTSEAYVAQSAFDELMGHFNALQQAYLGLQREAADLSVGKRKAEAEAAAHKSQVRDLTDSLLMPERTVDELCAKLADAELTIAVLVNAIPTMIKSLK